MNRPIFGKYDYTATQILHRVRRRLYALVSSNPTLAGLYYALLNKTFRAEQHAVSSGINRHLCTSAGRAATFRLRRSIHRIEKGLSMRQRRTCFGLNYIEPTVDDLTSFMKVDDGANFAEIQWYRSTLEAYFAVCTSTDGRFLRAREKFRGAGFSNPSGRLIPFPAGQREALTLDYSQLEALARRRRSVRWFLPTPIPRHTLLRAVATANQSPSACNRQSVRIRIFDNPNEARKITALAPGAAGLHHNFPAAAVLIGDLSAYAHERDRHAIYVDGGLKAMTFMYALEVLGVSTCALNWPENARLDKAAAHALGLAPHERVVLMIAAGVADPDGLIPYSFKENVSSA